MRFAGNVIWFIFGGWYTALFWLLGALVFALSIIGIPLTRAAIEMAKLSAWPFGREVVHVRELDGRELDGTTAVTGTIGFIFNILWAITFGLVLCLSYIGLGILFCITLIGIPFGLQSFKLAGISLWPVGRRVVTAELAHVARQNKANEDFKRYRQGSKATSRRAAERPEPALAETSTPLLAAPEPATERRKLPPQLLPDRGWFVEVVGELNYQRTIAREARASSAAADGKPIFAVTLDPEDDNPHDPNAVRVVARSGTVGYLPRESAREYRRALGSRRATCTAMVHSAQDDEDESTERFGIWLNAAWPPQYK